MNTIVSPDFERSKASTLSSREVAIDVNFPASAPAFNEGWVRFNFPNCLVIERFHLVLVEKNPFQKRASACSNHTRHRCIEKVGLEPYN